MMKQWVAFYDQDGDKRLVPPASPRARKDALSHTPVNKQLRETITDKLRAIYAYGREHADETWEEILYGPDGDRVGRWLEDRVDNLFLEAGRLGEDLPRWVEAERYGDLPEDGASYNHADNRLERGISVARLLDGLDDYEWSEGVYSCFGARNRPVVRVAGWLHYKRGGDGEPLLVGAVTV